MSHLETEETKQRLGEAYTGFIEVINNLEDLGSNGVKRKLRKLLKGDQKKLSWVNEHLPKEYQVTLLQKKPNQNPKKKTFKGLPDVQKELVAATNDSSIKSKRSMVRQGYFDDPFGRHFVPHPARRSPLINRGYYIRAAAVSRVISEFLEKYTDEPRQIISVGAGFDTTFFRLESQGILRDDDKFFEIDFPSVMQRKVEIVKDTPELDKLAPYLVPIPQPLSNTKAKLARKKGLDENQSITYSSGKLVPIGCDLAKDDDLQNQSTNAGIDLNRPTLILSECVLTYMFPDTSSKVISWGSSFTNVVFVMYEQSYPNDGFGEVMTNHFKKIGSTLRSIENYPTIPAYVDRFTGLGWKQVQVFDMNELYYNVIEEPERNRIDNLEPFDEYEEWHLKCSHYFVLIAQNIPKDLESLYLSSNIDTEKSIFQPATTNLSIIPLPISTNSYSNSILSHFNTPPIEPRGREEQLQRWSHASGQVMDKIIIFGGFGGKKHSRLNDVCIVDVNSWDITSPGIIGNSPSPRVSSTFTPYKDDSLLLFGGRTSISKPLNEVYILNVSQLTWKKIEIDSSNISPEPRWRHSAVQCDEGMMIIGGCDQKNVFSSKPWILDVSQSKWTQLDCNGDDIPCPRHSHSITRISKDRYLLIGGLNENGIPLNDIWMFDRSQNNNWKKLNTNCQSIYRYSHSTVLLNENNVLLVGGVGPRILSMKESFLNFDIERCEWQYLNCVPSNLPEGTMLNKHTTQLINENLVIIGGGGNCFSFGSHFNPFISIFSSKSLEFKQKNDEINSKSVSLNDISSKIDISSKKYQYTIESFDSNDMTCEKFTTLMDKRVPFIIKGNELGTSIEKWKHPEYLKKCCGDKLVSVHKSDTRYFDFVKKNYSFIVQPFSELIENTMEQKEEVSETKYYLRSLGDNARRDPSDIWKSFPELLENDFEIPQWFPYKFPNDERYFSSVFRIGSKDMQLWTHYDMMDNILCHISGIKHVTFWSPSLAHRMYLHGSTSEVTRIDEPNLKKYPLFPYDEAVKCILHPGDILFIPSLWFHNIYAEDACISINLFWRHLTEEFYEKKDLFGNKDLPVGVEAMDLAEVISTKLQSIPEEYRDFYARLAISSLVKNLSHPL